MSEYIDACRRCGKQLATRKKLAIMREVSRGKFVTDAYARYYCPECAEAAKEAIRAWESAWKA